MKKYMLIALRNISKVTFSKGMALSQKFYLLEGKACYYHAKSKTILCCYEEGFFDPTHLQASEIKLHLFEGAYLMMLEEEMLKDEVITATEAKQKEHLTSIW